MLARTENSDTPELTRIGSEQLVDNWVNDGQEMATGEGHNTPPKPALPEDWDGTLTVAVGTQVNHAGTTYPAGATFKVEDQDAASLWIQAGWATPNTKAPTKPAKAGH